MKIWREATPCKDWLKEQVEEREGGCDEAGNVWLVSGSICASPLTPAPSFRVPCKVE